MADKNEEKIIQELKDGLDYLDESTRVNIPDINQFRLLVDQVQEQKKTRQSLEFILFLVAAIFILSFETIAFNMSVISFIVVQILVITVVPLAIFFGKKQKRRRVDSI